MGQGGLAAAGRSPENHGRETVCVDGVPERPPLADNLILASQIIEGMGTHPFGQRRIGQMVSPWLVEQIRGRFLLGTHRHPRGTKSYTPHQMQSNPLRRWP